MNGTLRPRDTGQHEGLSVAGRKDSKKKLPSAALAMSEARGIQEAAGSAYASPWSKQRDREKERQIKRDAVLRMAGRIFTEKGFHDTSLDEVAERLHVSKPTLYYYVKNKDEILFECVRTGLEMLHAAVDPLTESGARPLARLEAAMRSYIDIVTQDFGLCVIRVGEDPLPPESRVKLRRLKAAIDSEFRTLVEECIADGSIAPCEAKMAAFALAGALSWIGRWYQVDGPYTPRQIADHFVPLLLHGLVRGNVKSPPPPSQPSRRGQRKNA